MSRLCAVAIIGSFLGIGTCDAASQSADAATVRAIYAKLMIASRVGALRDSSTPQGGAAPSSDTDSLKIVLDSIQTGPLQDILRTNLSALVTKPVGRVLQVTPGHWQFTTDRGEKLSGGIAYVSWHDAPYFSENWDIPIAQVIESGVLGSEYSRYAEVVVRLSFQGQQRQYAALFLFGDDRPDGPVFLPIDHIVGLPELKTLAQASAVPEPLLASPYRTKTATRRVIESIRAVPGCVSEPVTRLCCDEATGQCGLPSSVFELHGFASPSESHARPAATNCNCSAYNTTGPADPQNSAPNYYGHSHGGYHSAGATLQGTCTYQNNSSTELGCSVPTCHVQTAGTITYEVGPVDFPYTSHKWQTTFNFQDNQSITQQCTGAFGAAVFGCVLGICGGGVSVSLPPIVTVTTTSGNIWTFSFGLSFGPCQAPIDKKRKLR